MWTKNESRRGTIEESAAVELLLKSLDGAGTSVDPSSEDVVFLIKCNDPNSESDGEKGDAGSGDGPSMGIQPPAGSWHDES